MPPDAEFQMGHQTLSL
ncbi:hypothetical protein E2320_008448, partial [Naja naja]